MDGGTIVYDNKMSLENWMYDGKERVPTDVITVIVKDDIMEIKNYAFRDCQSLKSIHIPSSIKYIGEKSFYGCTALESIHLPSSITYIGDNAFSGCISLKSLQLPDGITNINNGTFYECIALESIQLPPMLRRIGEIAFSKCKSLSSIQLPSSVTLIDGFAFSGCTSLTSLHLPQSIANICFGILYQCTSLSSFKFSHTNKNNSNGNDSNNAKGVGEGSVMLLRIFLRSYPQYAKSTCTDDFILPLHFCLMFGFVCLYSDGIQELIKLAPKALTIRDPKYHFYPFLLAACTPLSHQRQSWRKRKSKESFDLEHLETIYVLLREAPWIIDNILGT